MGRLLATCACLLILGAAAFANSFTVPFQFDDYPSIVHNTTLRDLQAPLAIASFQPTRFVAYYSFAISYAMHGLDVAGYHAGSLAFHYLAAASLFALILVIAFLATSGSGLRASESDGSGLFPGEKPFTPVFDEDFRDPFTFATAKELNLPPPGPVIGPKTYEKDLVLNFLPRARKAFMEDRVAKTREICEEGLRAIGSEPEVGFGYEVKCARQDILRLLIVAERLLARRDAERAFEELDLKVSGIVTTGRHGRAIVNGRLLARGAVLEVKDTDEVVVVDAVEREEVIVLYRGIRIALPLGSK